MTKQDQYSILEAAKTHVMAWSQARGIPLHHAESVASFGSTDFGLSMWFFFRTDEQLALAETRRWSASIADTFRNILRSLGYDEAWIGRVVFYFDSHETVVRDYEGRYFYRLS